MKNIFISCLSIVFCMSNSFAQENTEEDYRRIYELEGYWLIDLRPSPSAEAYEKEMVLRIEEDLSIQGEFYNSEISDGYVNAQWEKVYFAFTTADQNHLYYHTGYILNDLVYGTTYCPSRDLISPWTGKRIE